MGFLRRTFIWLNGYRSKVKHTVIVGFICYRYFVGMCVIHTICCPEVATTYHLQLQKLLLINRASYYVCLLTTFQLVRNIEQCDAESFV
jgi:hypothetical protein